MNTVEILNPIHQITFLCSTTIRPPQYRTTTYRRTTQQMDGPRSGKVQYFTKQKALWTPNPMGCDRIHERCQHDGIPDIGPESTSFGNTTTDNRGGGTGKDELKEPQDIVVTVDQKVIRIANEFGITVTVRKGKTNGVVTQCGNTNIHQVFSVVVPKRKERTMSEVCGVPHGTFDIYIHTIHQHHTSHITILSYIVYTI